MMMMMTTRMAKYRNSYYYYNDYYNYHPDHTNQPSHINCIQKSWLCSFKLQIFFRTPLNTNNKKRIINILIKQKVLNSLHYDIVLWSHTDTFPRTTTINKMYESYTQQFTRGSIKILFRT
jgi:uncharacterized membrane protein